MHIHAQIHTHPHTLTLTHTYSTYPDMFSLFNVHTMMTSYEYTHRGLHLIKSIRTAVLRYDVNTKNMLNVTDLLQ